MSCLTKIKEILPTLTKTEAKLAEYILQHNEEISSLSTQELAQLAEVSTAAVVRFSYRLRYRGFPALKIALASEQQTDVVEDSVEFCLDDKWSEIIMKRMQMLQSVFEKTYRMIQTEELEGAINLLSDAKHIYIVGAGENGALCLDLQYNLIKLGKIAMHHPDNILQAIAMDNIESTDVCIVLGSTTKESNSMRLVKKAKEKDAKVVGIMDVKESALDKACDFVLHFPVQENPIFEEDVYQSIKIIIDLIQIGLLKKQ